MENATERQRRQQECEEIHGRKIHGGNTYIKLRYPDALWLLHSEETVGPHFLGPKMPTTRNIFLKRGLRYWIDDEVLDRIVRHPPRLPVALLDMEQRRRWVAAQFDCSRRASIPSPWICGFWLAIAVLAVLFMLYVLG